MSQSQSTPARRLTSQQSAARHFQTSVRTVRNWMGAGHIKGYRVAPRRIFVDIDDIEVAFKASKMRDPRKVYGSKSQIVDLSTVVLPESNR